MAQHLGAVDSRARPKMPTLVTHEKLKEAVETGAFLSAGDPTAVEGIKYDFHLGTRVLKACYRRPIDVETDLSPTERKALCVDPGEVVFVLTREKLNLPKNIMAVLAPKRKLAHGGIIVLGGQAIDPLYNGVLWVGLYNFSSTPFPLTPGRKLIAAMFYELTKAEIAEFPIPEAASVTDFPDELVALINQYRPVELKGLQENLAETQRQLESLRSELTNDKQWREDFKSALMKHDQQLDTLIKALEKEQENRSVEDEKIKNKLENMSSFFLGARWVLGTVIFIVGITITAVITYFITDSLQKTAATPTPTATEVAPVITLPPASLPPPDKTP